jgi:ankyrin repeat protein
MLTAAALGACGSSGSSTAPSSTVPPSTVPSSAPPSTVPSAPPAAASSDGRAAAADLDLLAAAGRGDLAGVRAALVAGGDVRASDPTGATALVLAAYGNHVDVAAALVDAGSDVNHKDRSQQSAYLVATSEVGDDPRLLDLTLAHGADVAALDSFDGTGVIRAAHRGYPLVVGRLIAAGVDVDHVNNLGWTALLEAVILGDGGPDHQKVVAALVAAGADRTIEDRNGTTALEHARAKGQTEVVRLLL